MQKIKLSLILVLGFVLAQCSGKKETVAKEVLKPVKYGVVEASGGLQERTFNGITKSGSETKLSFRANGLITRLNARVGQRVRKGQVLAQLDQKDVLLSLDQAKVDSKNAQVQLETAASNLERVKKLYQSNNASLSDYDKAKSNYSSAQSSYEISQKSLGLKTSQLAYTRITAPMNGVISSVSVEVNEFAQAGSPVVTMSQEKNDDMEAEVGIPERYISKVHQGSNVKVRINSINKAFDAVITEVGYTSTGGTYPVTVRLQSPSKDIRPGMPSELTFTFGDASQEKQLLVPVAAVGEDQSGNFVYVLKSAQDKVYETKKVNVEIGAFLPGGFILRSGLNEGEKVAIAGLRSLYDGRKVTLLEN